MTGEAGKPVGILLCVLLAWTTLAQAQSLSTPELDRAEVLSWMDPPAARQLLDKLQPTARSGQALVQWLLARGISYTAEGNEEARSVIQRLHELGATEVSAEAASHIVKSYLYSYNDQFDRADAELKLIGVNTALPAFERYRLEVQAGHVVGVLGKREAALLALERARDLANALHSTPRVIETMIRLVSFYATVENRDPARSLMNQLETLARQTNDDVVLAEVCSLKYELADDLGEHAEQGPVLLEALHHARRSGSERIMAIVLVDLGSFYRERKAYPAAVAYSTEAIALARKLKRPMLERLALSDLGGAQIALGHLAIGKRALEDSIQKALASGDLWDAEAALRAFQAELERVGDLRGSLQVWHEEEAVREKLAAKSRDKALLELSAKFADERRARQIELLKRDNIIKSRDLDLHRLNQQMIVAATAMVLLVCGALFMGIVRLRKINDLLLKSTKYDNATGLLTRSYFNEQVLAKQAKSPFAGCLLLVGVDCLDRIHEAVGCIAGDEVLSALGKRLSSAVKDGDTIVRWTTDSFLVMTGPMSDAELNPAARRLFATINREPFKCNDAFVDCAASIGYASFPLERTAVEISLDDAITLVGKALRQARCQGRDRAGVGALVNASSMQGPTDLAEQLEIRDCDPRVTRRARELGNLGAPAGR